MSATEDRADVPTGGPVSGPDLSYGIEEQAGLISWKVGVWHDLGYENPPSPECKPIPPLGERSAEAIQGAHAAIEEIDRLAERLAGLRQQLVTELRQDKDARAVTTAATDTM
jgi:hypothetical protein